MIDYKKIESIVAKLEEKLSIEAQEETTIQQELDERIEEEKETTDIPTPSVEANNKNTVSTDEESIVASETTPGIEDEIGDEAKGGDPSVSNLVDTKVDVSTDKEVYPTKSEYVAKLQKHIKLAKAVKKSNKMTAEEKKEALQKIEDATKKAKKDLNIKKKI